VSLTNMYTLRDQLCRKLPRQFSNIFFVLNIGVTWHALWCSKCPMPGILLHFPGHHIRHLVSGTSTIFTDQVPTVNVCRKAHCMWASKFATVCHLVWQGSGM